MNLTQIDNRLNEIDKILEDNSKRRIDIEPLIESLEAELENYKSEMNFLSSQWNMYVREEKALRNERNDFTDKEKKIKQEKMYEEAFKKCPSFLEAMETPLQKYISKNHSNIFGIANVKPEAVIKDIEARLEAYSKPGVLPNITMAEIKDCQGAYNSLTKANCKLEIDKPEKWELDKNTNDFRIQNNFNTLFSNRNFKQVILKV
tara:strand:+ start:236 stop:847 length:612 start_codon:yes stop_codon:yes gene_type:complete